MSWDLTYPQLSVDVVDAEVSDSLIAVCVCVCLSCSFMWTICVIS